MGTIMWMCTYVGSITTLLFACVYAALDNSHFQTYIVKLRDLYCPQPEEPVKVDSISVCGHNCSGDAECIGFFYNLASRTCGQMVTAVSPSGDCQAQVGSRYFVKTDKTIKPACAISASLVSGTNGTNGTDGMGGISDRRITASSSHPNSYWWPARARLDSKYGWAPATLNNDTYIQFDFTSSKIVTSITTRGYARDEDEHDIVYDDEYVTSYRVLYSVTCVNTSFLDVTDATGSPLTFAGNTDGRDTVTNTFAEPIVARCVRVNPQTWEDYISLRVELFGC